MNNSKKLTLVYIGVPIIFMIVVFLVAFTIYNRVSNPKSNTLSPTPPVPSLSPSENQGSSVPPSNSTNPPVLYDTNAVEKLNALVENRQTLSAQDQKARNTILNSIGNTSGVFYTSDKVVIDYVKTADQFQVEILSTDITGAKQDAVNWFLSKGMSKEGLCKLPLNFYLNWDIAQKLRGQVTNFNPLPDGC